MGKWLATLWRDNYDGILAGFIMQFGRGNDFNVEMWFFATMREWENGRNTAKCYDRLFGKSYDGKVARYIYHYLSYLFKQLPLAKTEREIQALLPWHVDPKVSNGLVD